MLSFKQGGIKYHFLSLWHDSIWDWTPVSQAIGKLSTHLAKYKENESKVQSMTHFTRYWAKELLKSTARIK